MQQVIDWKTMDVNQLTAKQMYDYFKWPNASACEISQDFGGLMLGPPTSMIDGQKAICLDPAARPPTNGKCLVYSFGISNDWTFDELMEQYGCQVHSFDPSINKPSHNHSKNIQFHDWGLDDRDYVDSHGWKMRSLSSIYQELQHTGRILDYLKMDVEFAEWRALPQIIQSGMLSKVRQLHVEIHLKRDDSMETLRSHAVTLKSIEDTGMMRFDSEGNPYYRGIIKAVDTEMQLSLGYDLAWYQILPSN